MRTPRTPVTGERNCLQSCAHILPTITDVALTVATAGDARGEPELLDGVAGHDRDHPCGPALITTCAITPVTSTLSTSPSKRLRAEKPSPISGRHVAAKALDLRDGDQPPVALVTLRPRRPLRSHRRTVSTLTPSAFEASPIGTIRPFAPLTAPPPT